MNSIKRKGSLFTLCVLTSKIHLIICDTDFTCPHILPQLILHILTKEIRFI